MDRQADFNRDQADALCRELHVQIAALDARKAKLQTQMGRYIADNREAQVARLQNHWRETVVERRKLIDMLIDLGHTYPCDHGSGEL